MPFALSFVLEYLIIATLRTRLEQSDLDRQEQDKKQLGLFKYLLRGPIWYGFTKSVDVDLQFRSSPAHLGVGDNFTGRESQL